MVQKILLIGTLIAIAAISILTVLQFTSDKTPQSNIDIDYKKIISESELGYVNEFYGDFHYEPVNQVNHKNYGSLEQINLIGDQIQIHFSQNNYTLSKGYTPMPEFSYSRTFGVNDTFVAVCHDFTKSGAKEILFDSSYILPKFELLKYLGVVTIGSHDYFEFYHMESRANIMVPCSYPEVIYKSYNAIDLEIPENLDKEIFRNGLPKD